MKQTLFITGTDTGVGKTVLTALLTRFLRERGVNAAALKPVCSGGRADARALHAAMDGTLTLDEINPWHFRAPIAPLLAARREKRSVKLSQALAHVRTMQRRFDVVLVEGAGGLLSPLGVCSGGLRPSQSSALTERRYKESFDSRDLITALRATPIIVAPNKLGVVNQILLTLEALPPAAAKQARVVLMSPPKPGAASKTNLNLLAEFLNANRIFSLPWLGKRFDATEALKNPRVKRTLKGLID
ncbi:MAG: dethiobiotin synthase [Verrucomicrobiales bacterium]|nr:dethiobiotin synthase [Verrucomicrobiales bacterium]